MLKMTLIAATMTAVPLLSAQAQVKPASHTMEKGCDNALVCATMKDGRSVATSDCSAHKDGAVRYLYGDCQDED